VKYLPAVCLAWTIAILGIHEYRVAPRLAEALAVLLTPVTLALPGDILAGWIMRGAGLLALALTILGWREIGRLALRFTGSGRRAGGWSSSLAAGLGISGISVLALGLDGLVFRGLLLPLGLLPAVPALAGFRLPMARFRVPRLQGGTAFWVIALASGLAASSIGALAPISSIDALACHLARSQRLLFLHRYVPYEFDIFTNMAPLWEMLAALLGSIGDALAVNLASPALLAGLALLTYTMARSVLPPFFALGAAALVATNPFLVSLSVQGKNDLLVAFLVVSAMQVLIPRTRSAQAGPCLLAGAIIGLAFFTKYTAAPTLLAVAAVILLSRKRAFPLGMACAGFASTVFPLFIMNWLNTGDPVFPFGWPVFRSPWLSAGVTGQFADLGTVRNIAEWGPYNSEETFARLTALLPFALLLGGLGPALRGWAVAGGAFVAGWIAAPQLRFTAFLFPPASLLAASGLHEMTVRRGPGRFVFRAAVILQLLHTTVSPELADRLKAGLGLELPGSFLERRLTSYAAVSSFISTGLTGIRRILTVGEPKLALLGPRAQTGRFKAFPPAMFVHDSRNLDVLTRRMRRQGWDCLVYNRISSFFWRAHMAESLPTERDLSLWASFWKEHAQPVFESPSLDLKQGYFYVFRFVPGPAKANRAVLPGIEGWIYRMEEEIRAGRPEAARRTLAQLRRAAGDFGILDLVEEERFRNALPESRRKALLESAVAKGFRSPSVFLDLARLELKSGNRSRALKLVDDAARMDPRIDPARARVLVGLDPGR